MSCRSLTRIRGKNLFKLMIGKTRELAAVNIPLYVAHLNEPFGAGYWSPA
jgi:hypothetical protein